MPAVLLFDPWGYRTMTRYALLTLATFCGIATDQQPTSLPEWKAQEIDPYAGNVCYAVTTADVNGDSKPDVVVVTEDAVLWYENPSWQKHEIIRGVTERDNVCIAAHDIDGDGRVDFALGAGWRPPDTSKASTLQWIGRDAAGKWVVHPIKFNEPSLHRIRWGDVLGNGKKQLVAVPLQGRGTKGPNWGEGQGVKVLVYSVPDDPTKPDWPVEVADDSLHTIHNFELVDLHGEADDEILLGCWEGVFLLVRDGKGGWSRAELGDGYQANDVPHKGASEIKLGRTGDGTPFISTIEPWHGHQVVLYTPESGVTVYPGIASFRWKGWNRRVIDTGTTWGHAVWCADVDGSKGDEIVIGQRDPRTDDKPQKGPGVWVYELDRYSKDPFGFEILKQTIDDGGMACEDLCVADLDGDNRPDIIAGGRATHNVKIYWNRPPAKAGR